MGKSGASLEADGQQEIDGAGLKDCVRNLEVAPNPARDHAQHEAEDDGGDEGVEKEIHGKWRDARWSRPNPKGWTSRLAGPGLRGPPIDDAMDQDWDDPPCQRRKGRLIRLGGSLANFRGDEERHHGGEKGDSANRGFALKRGLDVAEHTQ